MQNPGFELLKQAFNEFTSKYNGTDIANRVVRSAAAGGKAIADASMKEFPKEFVNQLTKDLYTLISGQDTADGISTLVRSLDEEQVQSLVNGAVSKLQDPEVALKVASQVKELLSKVSADELEAMLDGALAQANVNPGQRFMINAFFNQLKPLINEMKNDSEEEIAEKIMSLADTIPSDLIAMQLAAITREVTPERISGAAHQIVGSLPSPKTIADIVHGVGATASKGLDQVAKSSTPAEAGQYLSATFQNIAKVVSSTLQNDQTAKKTFKPNKGGEFDL